MVHTYIRKRKDGGYSECSSPDELVGKGRCCHILEEGEHPMELTRVQRGMYEVKVKEDKRMTIEGQKETIIEFFNNLPKIDQEKQKRIIEFLESEDGNMLDD